VEVCATASNAAHRFRRRRRAPTCLDTIVLLGSPVRFCRSSTATTGRAKEHIARDEAGEAVWDRLLERVYAKKERPQREAPPNLRQDYPVDVAAA
jgi:hypothetical protein